MSLHSSAGVAFSAHNDVSQESQRSNSYFIVQEPKDKKKFALL